jgi:hypothetical protein
VSPNLGGGAVTGPNEAPAAHADLKPWIKEGMRDEAAARRGLNPDPLDANEILIVGRCG